MDSRGWTTPTRLRLIVGVLLVVAAIVALALSVSDGVDDSGSGSAPAGDTEAGATAGPGTTSGPTPSGRGSKAPKGSLSRVPVDEVTPEPPIALTETAAFGTKVSLRIVKVEKVKGIARGPGEIAGPALRLTLDLTNDSDDTLALEPMVVAVESGAKQTPAPSLTGPGSKPFAGELAPGRSATGTYVYAVPVADRGRVEVTVSSTDTEPVVVFRGAVRP